MRAITQSRYGSADVLELTDVEPPTPGEGEVLVRVMAAGTDRGAWHLMTGRPYLMRLLGFGFRAPRSPVPGTNLAGVVTHLGPGVTGFAVGDEVYGSGRGTFAELAVAPVRTLAPKPAELSFAQAAVLPYATFVALTALHRHGRLQAGQKVLVVGASGAVGTITVQAAVAAGATVTGVCSASHADLVRSLGAADVVDYRTEQITGSYDLIIDIGGRTPISRLRSALARKGTLVVVGGEGDRWTGGLQRQLWALLLSAFVPQRLVVFVVKESAEELVRMNELVAAGLVAPVMADSYPLADGVAAVAAFEAGQSGRVAVTV